MRQLNLVCFVLILLNSLATAHAQRESTQAVHKTLVYVGDYQNWLSILSFDASIGKLTLLSRTKVANRPSYILTDASGEYLYVVSEFKSTEHKWTSGSVAAYQLNQETGELKYLNSQESGGIPCYLSMDRKRRFLLCACFGGSVHVYPIATDGRLEKAATEIKYESVMRGNLRLESRAHSIVLSPDEKYAFVADRGRDRILQYRFDAARGTLTPNDATELMLAAGSGPRHLTFHPHGRFAYVVNEPKATVVSLAYDEKAGTLKQTGELSTVPHDFVGVGGGAEVAVSTDGKFLYASTRNNSSLLIAAIDSTDGTLSKVDIVDTQGVTPRSFALVSDDRFLLIAHRRSDEIICFQRNRNSGKLTELSRIRITNEAADAATGTVRIGVVGAGKLQSR